MYMYVCMYTTFSMMSPCLMKKQECSMNVFICMCVCVCVYVCTCMYTTRSMIMSCGLIHAYEAHGSRAMHACMYVCIYTCAYLYISSTSCNRIYKSRKHI
jgi:hypothetical protein